MTFDAIAFLASKAPHCIGHDLPGVHACTDLCSYFDKCPCVKDPT